MVNKLAVIGLGAAIALAPLAAIAQTDGPDQPVQVAQSSAHGWRRRVVQTTFDGGRGFARCRCGRNHRVQMRHRASLKKAFFLAAIAPMRSSSTLR
jgi:hypothetical protein